MIKSELFWKFQVLLLRTFLCYVLQILGAGYRPRFLHWQREPCQIWQPCSYLQDCWQNIFTGTLLFIWPFLQSFWSISIKFKENKLLVMGFNWDVFSTPISCQAPRKFTSKVEGKMGYEDFVYFMLSEEDKSSDPSLEYWYILPACFLCLTFSCLQSV